MKNLLRRWLGTDKEAENELRVQLWTAIETKRDIKNDLNNMQDKLAAALAEQDRLRALTSHQAEIIEVQRRHVDVLKALVGFYEEVGLKAEESK